jgi:hypothetical protein
MIYKLTVRYRFGDNEFTENGSSMTTNECDIKLNIVID